MHSSPTLYISYLWHLFCNYESVHLNLPHLFLSFADPLSLYDLCYLTYLLAQKLLSHFLIGELCLVNMTFMALQLFHKAHTLSKNGLLELR